MIRTLALASLIFCVAHSSQAADIFAPQGARQSADSAAGGRVERLEKQMEELLKRLEEEPPSQKKDAVGGSSKMPPAPFGRPGLPEVLPDPFVKTGPEERVLGEVNGFEVYVVDGFVKRREIGRKERRVQ